MMNRVRNSARLIITLFGGVCWVPMALRRNDSTTMIRVNEVIITSIDGASEMTVSSASIWMIRAVLLPPPSPKSRLSSCASATPAVRDSTAPAIAVNSRARAKDRSAAINSARRWLVALLATRSVVEEEQCFWSDMRRFLEFKLSDHCRSGYRCCGSRGYNGGRSACVAHRDCW